MRKERTPAINHPFKSKLLLLDNKTAWAFCNSIKSTFKKNQSKSEKMTTIKKEKTEFSESKL